MDLSKDEDFRRQKKINLELLYGADDTTFPGVCHGLLARRGKAQRNISTAVWQCAKID